MSNSDEPAVPAGPIPPSGDAIQATPPAPRPPEVAPDRPAHPPITVEGLARATWQLDRFLAALLFVLAFALASFAIHNSDFWMHLATGRALAEGTYNVFAGNDPFSYTTEGVRWINQAWLFDWALYGLFLLLGGPGLVVLKGVLVVALAVVLLRIHRPGQSLWAPVFCVGLALLALSPGLLLRPTLLSYLLLGITLSLLMREVKDRPDEAPPGPPAPQPSRSLWVLPPLFALWANLDGWFLLGPLTVSLVLLGDWLGKRLSGGDKSDLKHRKQVTLVLPVGLAACLLNPNGLYVFALPPELAYLVVQATGPSPSEFVAAGTTVHELAGMGTALVPYFSPLREAFWHQPATGLNVAGVSYFVLLALGILSFVLAAPTAPASRSAGQPPGFGPRLLVWLLFAVLSLFVYRLIPFFAIVAGPITALNFQDFAHWCYGTGFRLEGRWRLWSLGGRLATAAGFLGLLFLAWPGWLHAAADDPRHTHRIAWQLYEDPSLRRAAERIGELQQTGKLKHAYNYAPEVANYLSWFAPGDENLFRSSLRAVRRLRGAIRTRAEVSAGRGRVLLQGPPESADSSARPGLAAGLPGARHQLRGLARAGTGSLAGRAECGLLAQSGVLGPAVLGRQHDGLWLDRIRTFRPVCRSAAGSEPAGFRRGARRKPRSAGSARNTGGAAGLLDQLLARHAAGGSGNGRSAAGSANL